MISRTATACLAAAVTAVALCGCGSDTLTPRALRTRATALCAAAIRRSGRIPAPSSNAAGANFLAQGIAIFRPELDALRKLPPPHELAEAYRVALGDSTQQLDALIAAHSDLARGQDPVLVIHQLDVELSAINTRDAGAWQAVGAPTCSNTSATAAVTFVQDAARQRA